MKKYNYLIAIFSIFLIVGCGGGSTSSYNNYENDSSFDSGNNDSGNNDSGGVDNQNNKSGIYPKSQKVIDINSSDVEIKTISKTSDSKITLNINYPKDIYVVVSSHFDNQDVSINSSNSNNNFNKLSKEVQSVDTNAKLPKNVLKFRANVHKLLHKQPVKEKFHKFSKSIDDIQEGSSTFDFCTNMDDSYLCSQSVSATARKVVKNIQTKWGEKNLIIWVADDEYDDGYYSSGTINQEMVDNLANQFLQNSDDSAFDDDIYDWDSNIFGQEWGDDAKNIDPNLIANNDTIEILVYNMHTQGLAGYFWPKDNFIKSYVPASNEKIMFYVNSQLYAKDAKETFTTLAHEFQHMIHFYQRDVKLNIKDPIWFNEMLSEAAEDLLAVKLKHKGPRNVDYTDGSAGSPGNNKGRYPNFNKYDYASLTNWYDSVINYSIVSSFGAYLIRNYNGAKVLHDMMYSEYKGKDAVVDATGVKDFNILLNRWGAGVVLSDRDDLDSSKPRYNFGDFIISSFGGIDYKIGSINFFNYIPQPLFKNSETLDKDANLYYKVGENLSGKVNLNISIPKGGDITIIAK